MVRARRSQRGSRNAVAQPATVPENSILEVQDGNCDEDAVDAAGAGSADPSKDKSMQSLLRSLPSPARSRMATGKCVGDRKAAGQMGASGVRAGPEPWNHDASSASVAAASMGYREQLRASGQQAMDRLWHRGGAQKSPSSLALDLTPTPTYGHNFHSAGAVLASLELMPPTSGCGSPAAHDGRHSQCGAGAPLNLADACLMPAAGPPQPSQDPLPWRSTATFTQLAAGPAVPPLPPMVPMPMMMPPVAMPLQQRSQSSSSTLQSNLLAIIMPGADSLDSQQIVNQLEAAAQCQYDD